MTTISTAAMVVVPGMRTAVTLTDIKTVDRKIFFKLGKANPHVVRLLTGHAVGENRKLCNTDIVETLVTLRNSKYDELAAEHNLRLAAKEDLGIDRHAHQRVKRIKMSNDILPKTMVIEAPPYGDVQGIDMTVMTGFSGSVWVELVPETVDYLRSVVDAQLASGSIKRSSAKNSETAEGDA